LPMSETGNSRIAKEHPEISLPAKGQGGAQMRTREIALSGLMTFLALSGVALTATGCAGTNYHRSTGAYLDDKAIATRVKTALFRDPLVSGFDVHVNTFRGDVMLSGFVDSPEQKARAGQIASEVKGVRSVTDNLEVKPGAVGTSAPAVSSSSGTISHPIPENPALDNSNRMAPAPANQAPINTPAPNVITPNQTPMVNPGAASFEPTPSNLNISVDNGRATVRGTVASPAQSQAIESQVRSIPGVQAVDNQLQVQNPSNR
jgi:hyperosmotically inducible periplasmic protein